MEKYRPKLHMTPKSGWMNDPNGLVYFNGEYHQFYQYYPCDTVWGPMHWGHQVSKDLITWEELEPALYPDENGMCFSGSAVVDWNNASGLFEAGKPGLLAFYTSFILNKRTLANGEQEDAAVQQQSLAYSQDGYTWHKYMDGKPIIPARGNPDFRDPKVIWHEQSKSWVMVVSCGQHIEFYSSTNLIDWKLVSEFGYQYGAHSKGPWECPDLFELTVEGSGEKRWVLVVGIGEGAHCGGAGTQYFIGDFDGKKFTSENGRNEILWLDFGRDYYATQTFSDIPTEDNRRIASTWMSNHQYSLELPTKEFRSAMTTPRELYLYHSPQGIRLGQRFVRELSHYLTPAFEFSDMVVAKKETLSTGSYHQPLLMSAELDLNVGDEVKLSLYSCRAAEYTFIRRSNEVEVVCYRQGSFGKQNIDTHYPHDYRILLPIEGCLKLDVLADNGSLELLVNGGQFSFTNLVFAESERIEPRLSSLSGSVNVNKLLLMTVNDLKCHP